MKRTGFKPRAPHREARDPDRVRAFAATELGVSFPASFQQWEQMQADPDTGEIIGGINS